MNKIKLGVKISFFCLWGFGVAAEEVDPAKQQALQAELEHSLVAPCCWNMTVDQHDSPASREVRKKIAELIQQGKTKDEILAYFVAQPNYGERILASPSKNTFLGKTAYWITGTVLVLGGLIVAVSLRRMVKPSGQRPQAPPKAASTGKPGNWDERVERELADFE
jgi:cytochrome c-type biogenesis protein CcmH